MKNKLYLATRLNLENHTQLYLTCLVKLDTLQMSYNDLKKLRSQLNKASL